MSCLRVAIASSAVIFFAMPSPLAQPVTTRAVRLPIRAVARSIARGVMSPPCECAGACRRPAGVLLALADLVADGRDRLQELGDGHAVGLAQVLVAGQRAVDELPHQPAGHVAIRLVAGA